MLTIDRFIDFLIKAKSNACVISGDGGGVTLPNGTKLLTYREGNLRYVDKHRGPNPFYGLEEVSLLLDEELDRWEDLWFMQYGQVFRRVEELDDRQMRHYNQFLREALGKMPRIAPFRGPSRYPADGGSALVYTNQWCGGIDFFHGEEQMHDIGELVYTLYYHGGLLRPL